MIYFLLDKYPGEFLLLPILASTSYLFLTAIIPTGMRWCKSPWFWFAFSCCLVMLPTFAWTCQPRESLVWNNDVRSGPLPHFYHFTCFPCYWVIWVPYITWILTLSNIWFKNTVSHLEISISFSWLILWLLNLMVLKHRMWLSHLRLLSLTQLSSPVSVFTTRTL